MLATQIFVLRSVNKETSKVKLTVESIELDLDLPGNKRCTKTVQLYEAIDPDASDFKILGTKVSRKWRLDIKKKPESSH